MKITFMEAGNTVFVKKGHCPFFMLQLTIKFCG